MSKYYYLISSLPYLEFKQQMPISRNGFLAEAQKWLKPSDLQYLERTNINDLNLSGKDLTVVREWKLFEFVLRENLAEVRMAKRSGIDKKVSALVKSIFEQKDPLAMETVLMKMRWDFLDEKQRLYFFDLNWLVVYFLKLQILERFTGFDKQKGIEAFDKLCEVTNG